LQKYVEVSEICDEFYTLRYKYYENRKEYLISAIKKEFEILSNKLRFIKGVIKGDVDIRNKKKK
jgi:DNA gyrase/topoisomerase IV subunit A